MNFLANKIKHAVSQNRNRYVDGDYDLDLTYITNRIIAMGFPGDGLKGLYRNDSQAIAQFLGKYHHGRFMIFNLSQLTYGEDKFENNVMSMGWPDNHNPPLDLLFTIIKTMHAWLSSSADNVVAVHCLAGKGRTGTVIVCYLLYIGMFKTVREALEYFAMKRTDIMSVDVGSLAGVDSPSQMVYINYFYDIITGKVDHSAVIRSPPIFLQRITLHNIPPVLSSQILSEKFSIEVCQMTTLGPNNTRLIPLMTFKKLFQIETRKENSVSFKCDLEMHRDIVTVCKVFNTLGVDEIFRFAFHTGFIKDKVLKKMKDDMDVVRNNTSFSNDFSVELQFILPSDSSSDHRERSKSLNDMPDKNKQSVEPSCTPGDIILDSIVSHLLSTTQRNKNIKILPNHEVIVLEETDPVQGSNYSSSPQEHVQQSTSCEEMQQHSNNESKFPSKEQSSNNEEEQQQEEDHQQEQQQKLKEQQQQQDQQQHEQDQQQHEQDQQQHEQDQQQHEQDQQQKLEEDQHQEEDQWQQDIKDASPTSDDEQERSPQEQEQHSPNEIEQSSQHPQEHVHDSIVSEESKQ